LGFLENEFGAVYTDGPGQPPLPTRLMAGLIILKYTHNLSDEVLCERWVENPYYQFFCGEEFFQHELVLDRSSLSNWRKRMGEEKVKALLQESLSIAAKTGAVMMDAPQNPRAGVRKPTKEETAIGGRSRCGRR
jgi:IS5 family transposase